jgi:hypothetical protein
VSETFTAAGATAAALARAVRDLSPALDAAVEKARTAISTETLLVDDEDRRFEATAASSRRAWSGSLTSSPR